MNSILMNNVLSSFKRLFPEYAEKIQKIFSFGKDTIRIIMKDHSEFIFRYAGDDDYCFETKKSYERR